jgi:hypothetical protein
MIIAIRCVYANTNRHKKRSRQDICRQLDKQRLMGTAKFAFRKYELFKDILC